MQLLHRPTLNNFWFALQLTFILFFVNPFTANAQQYAPDTSQSKVPTWPKDSLGRRSPRGTVRGFIESAGRENYAEAALYLNLKGTARKDTSRTGPKLAEALQRLLDHRGNIIPRTLISSEPNGMLDDNLPTELDLIGTATVDGKPIDVLVEKTIGPDGGPIWLFSSVTVQQVPGLTADKTKGFNIDRFLPDFLLQNRWWNVPIGHWMATLLLGVVSYFLAQFITQLLVRVLQLVWSQARETKKASVIQAFVLPIRIIAALMLFVNVIRYVGISLLVRQSLSEFTVLVGLVAFLLLLWQLVDVFSRVARYRLVNLGKSGGLSAILFMRRGIKLLLIAFGIISALSVFGLNVTSGLAALGIGGIALALGAQKTVENFVGSLTIIFDQPIRIGDFCKVDGASGTVEQIGMRSTHIRTLDRTLLIIPNGQLAALKIENFAYRDRILYNPTLGLRYETTPEQIRNLLLEIRSILNKDSAIGPDPARVRLLGWENNKLNVEVFCYINVRDYSKYLEYRENLTLQILEAVSRSGTALAFPSQALYMGNDTPHSEGKNTDNG